MTQRLVRRAEDRFITTSSGLEVSRRGLLTVSIVTRFPVIGSRMVMRQPSPVQAKEERATRGIQSEALVGVVTRRLTRLTLASPKPDEAVHPRPAGFGGEG
jgi:hypothetical protein